MDSCGGNRNRSRSKDHAELLEEDKEYNDDEEEETENGIASLKYEPLNFKLYLENSGSMFAYDNPKTNGDFRNIVSGLLTHLPPLQNDTVIYVVNDNIYPFNKGIKEFLTERNFMQSVKDKGNINYTDFQTIFTQIEDSLQDDDVAILFSDLIYSLKNQQEVNPNQLVNEAKRITEHVTKNHPDVQVKVIKFEADYNGNYYPYNSPNKGVQYVGPRPFYAMIFAKSKAMDALQNDPANENFRNFSKVPGYQDEYTFTNQNYKPFYTIVMKDYSKKGNVNKDDEKEEGKKGKYRKKKKSELNKDTILNGEKYSYIHSIDEMELDRNGELVMPIAINLSGIPATPAYKTDLANYEVNSATGFKIISIKPIDSNIKELGNATHIINLQTKNRPKNETVKLKMRNELPRWIYQSNSDDDRETGSENFGVTTFGFGNMMEGIYDAKIPSSEKAYYFEIPIYIDK